MEERSCFKRKGTNKDKLIINLNLWTTCYGMVMLSVACHNVVDFELTWALMVVQLSWALVL